MATLRNQLNRFRTIVIILVIVIVALAFIALRRSSSTGIDPALNIQTVQVRNVENIVTAEGYLHGKDERLVYFPAQTRVKEVRVSLNQEVSKDAVLAVVETTAGVKVTTEVKSPIAGTITQVGYKEGDLTSTAAGFQVVDFSEYKVVIAINETDIADVKLDQDAKISFSAISLDDEYSAKVTLVSPSPLSSTGVVNYEVDLKPTTLPEKIKLGMSTDVGITTAKVENVLAIPETYLIEKDNKNYVKVLTWKDEGKTQYDIAEKEIELGLKTNEYIEVKSGLTEGTEIVEPSFVSQGAFSLFGK